MWKVGLKAPAGSNVAEMPLTFGFGSENILVPQREQVRRGVVRKAQATSSPLTIETAAVRYKAIGTNAALWTI